MVAVAEGGGVAAAATTADDAVLVDEVILAEEVASGDVLVEAGTDSADVVAEGGGEEGTGETEKAGEDLVGGGFAGGPAELEEGGIDILDWGEGKVDKLEAEVGEGDGKAEIVEPVETEEHENAGSKEEGEKFVGIAEGFLEVEAALADVDFDESCDGIENIPLGVGDE